MQKYYKKHDNVHYINKNYVLKPIYNDENECINDTLSNIHLEHPSCDKLILNESFLMFRIFVRWGVILEEREMIVYLKKIVEVD